PQRINETDPGRLGRATGGNQSQAHAPMCVQVVQLANQPVMETREGAREVGLQVLAGPSFERQKATGCRCGLRSDLRLGGEMAFQTEQAARQSSGRALYPGHGWADLP